MKYTLALLTIFTASVAIRAEETAPRPSVVVPFELVPSGHFIVKVMLNGYGPYNLIFDTGAPTTLISPRVAQDAKLTNKAKDKPIIPIFGMGGQVKVKDFQVGEAKAKDVVSMILDHPTVKLFSQEYEKKYGKIEGIVGFPFFAQYKMTVDYASKKLTFTPNGYVAEDITQSLMKSVMESMSAGSKPTPRIVSPQAVWGFDASKSLTDSDEGITIEKVLEGSAAAKAGLKPGDRLLTLDGRWTDSFADLLIAVESIKPNKTIKLTIKRDGKETTIAITPKTGL